MEGWMNRRMDGRKGKVQTDGRKDRWNEGQKKGQLNRRTDGTDGRIEEMMKGWKKGRMN